MLNPQLYRKGDSMRSLRSNKSAGSLSDRFIKERAKVAAGTYSEYQTQILTRALNDLLDPNPSVTPAFWLRPHVEQEISVLPEADLGRYLFHRYRYDIFPVTKELDDFPPCVQIEPTSICNFRCVFCFQTDPLLTKPKEGHMGQIPLDRFMMVVDELEGNVDFVTMASRGEPLLTKGIEEMLAYASGKFLGLKMNTNATFLTEEKAHAILQADLNTLVFSADAADPVTYPQLRVNGDFDKVMGNIRRFMEIKERDYPKSRMITRVSGVAFDRERQDHAAIEAFWSDFVDQVAFVDYNPWENAYDNDPNGVEEACSDLWRRTFVWWDGRMNPCDVDYRSFLSPGNVDEVSVAGLWAGPAYSHLREQHLAMNRQGITPCRGCITV